MLGNAADKTYSAENTVTSFSRRAYVEWNMNYYFDIATVNSSLYGTSEPEFFKRFFPLKEVTRGWRPPAGAFRGRFGDFKSYNLQWPRTADRSNLNFACNAPTDNTYTLKTRLYTALDNTHFKYYDSPVRPSSASFVDPYIEYQSNNLYANKVVVGFQTAAGIPKTFSIQIKNSGGWTTIGSFSSVSAVDSEGRVTLYYNGTSWSTSQPADSLLVPANMTNIRGIKVIVDAMGRSNNATDVNAFLSIIDMSPRALLSFTDRLQDWQWSANMAENDSILPIGSISSNSGSIVLNNNDGLLEPDPDSTSPSYGYFMRQYGKVTVEYKASDTGTTWVKQFTGYVEQPDSGGVYETLTLTLTDKLSFAKEIPAQDMLLRSHTPTAIIYTLLDLAGIGPVTIKHDGSQEPVVTYFYSNNEETVFDAIQEICRAHQYAIAVDENDNVVIYTRGYLFNNRTNQYVLTTDAISTGGIDYIPNVKSYEDSYSEIINSANITYRPLLTSSATDPDQAKFTVKNQVAFSRAATLDLWRPEQPLLLGVASIIKPIGANDTSIWIDRAAPRNASWGNYKGYALIDSEIIKFDGLEFAYTPKSGAPASPRIAKNMEEFSEIVSYASGVVTFTGRLCNVERGQFGTSAAAHSLALTGWSKAGARLITDSKKNGYLQIRNGTSNAKRISYAVKVIDSDSYWVNTRMAIDNIATKVKSAGLVVSAHVDSNGLDGIYVEASQGTNGKKDTVSVYHVSNSIIGKSPIATAIFDVQVGKLFNMSVFFKSLGGNSRQITVYIDEHRILKKTFTTTMGMTKMVGMAASGDTSARFDYVFGGRGADGDNQQSALDGQLKNYVSDMVKRDRGQLPYRQIPNLASVGFERFDDYAREIYVEDIRFTRGPAYNVEYILTATNVRDVTNGKNIALGSEIAGAVSATSPFGAVVTVANLTTQPLVISYVDEGGKELLYPYIYGKIIEEFQEARHSETSESSIFRYGEKKFEFTSRWVNNKNSASSLAKWVIARGADPKRQLTLGVWSPHCLQVGDQVTVNIPEKGINADYIVFGIDKTGKDIVDASVRLVER